MKRSTQENYGIKTTDIFVLTAMIFTVTSNHNRKTNENTLKHITRLTALFSVFTIDLYMLYDFSEHHEWWKVTRLRQCSGS